MIFLNSHIMRFLLSHMIFQLNHILIDLSCLTQSDSYYLTHFKISAIVHYRIIVDSQGGITAVSYYVKFGMPFFCVGFLFYHTERNSCS